ncbi:DUF2157 domain-containing protein [Halomonas sp. YLGW01]|uniref:DUF2157 domain-containing protein n=1 Tax=Halomonas sp. YLGW01 TaxID=2773308 RepID=UPI00177BE089|nr:DUF2157 domain-containing protein [Halomonas sp. YLGW01]
MDVQRHQLEKAAKAGVIREEQAGPLWEFLLAQGEDTPRLRFTHILYYLGGLIAIGAMSLFMTLGWERFGGAGLVAIALLYAVAGLWLTESFLRRQLPIPAGLAAAFVVVLTPLAIYGLQVMLGWWAEGHVYREYHTHIDWRWLVMELGTLASGAAMLWRYRLPFLVMPVAVTLWYLSMDLAPLLFDEDGLTWALRHRVSLWVGLAIVVLAVWIDLRSRLAQVARGDARSEAKGGARDDAKGDFKDDSNDYAFWLYLFGVAAFWGGLSLHSSESEWQRVGYLCINLVMIVVGAVLLRRVFVVFGGLGTAGYLGHLAYDVFEDSLLFPIALTLIGLGVIWLGILWQRHEAALTERLYAALPPSLRALIDRRPA